MICCAVDEPLICFEFDVNRHDIIILGICHHQALLQTDAVIVSYIGHAAFQALHQA